MTRTVRALAGLLILHGLALATPASAEPVYTEIIDTYPIRGQTIAELRASIRQHGLVAESSTRPSVSVARAKPQFQWSYKSRPAGGVCAITEITVTLHETIVMPEWADSEGATPALQAEWTRYRENVLAHERGHAAISLVAARRLETDLLKVTAPACDSIKAALRANAVGIIERHNEEQRAFDAAEGSCQLRKSCLKETR